jgi:acyl transferase domain-containing protein/acyl-CoA synthetase (AMP-forming)/AMP-acid ligase II/NADPH:quinone reductase-like Zn-dependent oxidoreductase/acyl carrier protein
LTNLPPPNRRTLVDYLRRNAQELEDGLAFRFLETGDVDGVINTLSFRQVEQTSLAIGATMAARGKPGDRAILLYPPGLDFITGFVGCLSAGMIAVSATPPDPSRLKRTLGRLRNIVADCEPRFVITTAALARQARAMFGMAPELAQLEWIATDEIPATEAAQWSPPGYERVAFLQYTSGSTGTPKGTVITHENLLHNHALMIERFEHDRTSHWLSWLPVYHDMGLIAGALLPISIGITGTQMPPGRFLQKPMRWLKAISEYGATTSGGPNFGFDLCVRKVKEEDFEGLDLSGWQTAFNGAEPVRADTLSRFAKLFERAGFRNSAFAPCFGLAEGTLCCTLGKKSADPIIMGVNADGMEKGEAKLDETADATVLVGSGHAGIDMRVEIVDPGTGIKCPENRVGEIWVHGPSIADRYWRRPEETEETFGATLAGFDGTWLRTGDLGFLSDAELFVTGRIKDLIILRGRNLYPHDIELTAERCHPALRPGASAAFSLEVDGEETVGLVAEVQPQAAESAEALAEAAAAVRAAVATHHDASVHTIGFILPRTLQKTTSGKVMRRATRAGLLAGKLKFAAPPSVMKAAKRPAPRAATPAIPAQAAPQTFRGGDPFSTWLVGRVAELCGLTVGELDLTAPLANYGLDSRDLVGLSGDIGDQLGRPVETTLIYSYPTLQGLIKHLRGDADIAVELRGERQEPVAIIGIGCRFPGGVTDADSFWALLRDEVDAITEVPADRWDIEAYYDADGSVPGKVVTRFGGFLDGIEEFDAAFFGISPREAVTIDPQERLLLEASWEALEAAGLPPSTLMHSDSGVYMGICSSEYQAHAIGDPKAIDAYSLLNTTHSGMAGRLSYWLGFTGPCVAVDTACSSSLVSVHMACQALRNRECGVALAGGVQLNLKPEPTIYFSRLNVMSPTGRCRTFSDDADGYVRSEGCGVLALKLLSDAERDGDTVLAVIRGSAINQDGRSAGLAAPSGRSQQAVIRKALAAGGVAPADIDYQECHGTGTALGDPIEVNALAAVLAEGRADDNPVRVGTVKSNFGHAEGAAGVAGLIKTVLSLRHETIPRTLHYTAPNPRIDWKSLPVQVAQEAIAWPRGDKPRFGSVSSFGFSGTNAHVVLEEGPPTPEVVTPPARDSELVVLSGRSEAALTAQATRLAAHIDANPEQSLGALAQSLATSRDHFEHRIGMVEGSVADLRASLDEVVEGKTPAGATRARAVSEMEPTVVFVFPGQGSQWLGMGRELLASEPAFAEAMQRCDAAIQAETGWSVLAELAADEGASRLTEIDVVQPTLFAIEVALAALWQSWGVIPNAVVGHSMGEVAAVHVAGALCLEDAAAVICRRSKLMRTISGSGEMAVVELSLEQAQAAVAAIPTLAVAVNNGPRSTVISGDPAALATLLTKLEGEGVFVRRVQVDVASHSPQVDPLKADLLAALSDIAPAPSRVPICSTVRADFIGGEELSTDYWFSNLREPVRFAEVVAKLLADRSCHFVEMSPHPILVPALRENLSALGATGAVTGSLRRGQPERGMMLEGLATLHVHGHPLDWEKLHTEPSTRLDLPRYAFQRERHWLDAPTASAGSRLGGGHPLLGGSLTLSTRTSTRIWESTLGRDAVGWLTDHEVQGAVVLPGAAYVEMALSAHGGSVAVESLALKQALALPPEGELRVQTVLSEPEAGRWQVHISSAPAGSDDWTEHAQATLRPHVASDEAAVASTISTDSATPSTDLYAELEAAGLHYGPAFQGIEAITRGDGESLARMRLTEAVAAGSSRYRVHPALLDACFQVLAGALGSRAGTWVPVHIGRVEILGDTSTAAWCLARMEEDIGSLQVTDIDGAVVLRVGGLKLQKLTESLGATETDGWFLAHRLIAAEPAERTIEKGNWLLVGAGDGDAGRSFGQSLRAALREAGQKVVLAPATDAEAIAATLAEAFDGAAPTGIVYLAGLEISQAPGDRELLASCDPVVHLLQGIAAMNWRDSPRLCLLTRGAQAAGGVTSPGQSALLGLGRAIAMEEPALRCVRIDLDPAGGGEDLVVAELLADTEEEELAFREGGRQLARLGRSVPDAGSGERTVPAEGRAFRLDIDQPGVLDRLTLRETPRRTPGPGEVEVAVEATGLNFLDVLTALGVMPAEADGTFNLGGECAGRVVSVGEGVEGLASGQPVVAFAGGAFASHVIVPAALVVPTPEGINMAEAAALPIATLTAWYALDKVAHLEKGDRVLIHAATGGVGHAAVQWAQHVGAEVFATAGSDVKRAHLADLGVKYISDSRSDAFVADVMKWTDGEGVDVVLNSLSGELLEKSFSLLRDHGHFVELGKRDYLANNSIGLQPFLRNLSLSLVDLKGMIRKRPATIRRLFGEMVGLGVFTPPPIQIFDAAHVSDAFRTMAQAKHIGKLVITMTDPDVPIRVSSGTTLIQDEGAYLVVGGLGGLGQGLCQWLVGNGATDLIIVHRSEPNADQLAGVAALREQGATVRLAQADAANRAQLGAAVDLTENLRGVFQLAGVLDDGLLQTQDTARFHKVLGPKALGAWNLHQLTADKSLDLFVMYASGAGLLGSPGQGNYAAANAFLDGLAHFRHAQGLPAHSIDWGAFSEVGAAATVSRADRLAGRGTLSLTPDQGLEALERVLATDHAQVGVVPLDVRQWVEFYPSAAGSSLLSDLVAEDKAGGQKKTGDAELLDALAQADAQGRLRLMESFLSDQVSQVLRIKKAALSVDAPLTSLGMDSLMGLELRNRIEGALGLNLPASVLWTYSTITALGAHLSGLISPTEDADIVTETAADAAEAAGDAVAQQTEAELEEMDADDLAALLEAELLGS